MRPPRTGSIKWPTLESCHSVSIGSTFDLGRKLIERITERHRPGFGEDLRRLGSAAGRIRRSRGRQTKRKAAVALSPKVARRVAAGLVPNGGDLLSRYSVADPALNDRDHPSGWRSWLKRGLGRTWDLLSKNQAKTRTPNAISRCWKAWKPYVVDRPCTSAASIFVDCTICCGKSSIIPSMNISPGPAIGSWSRCTRTAGR